MKDKLYVLGYTLAVTAAYGLLVSSLNAALKEKARLNKDVAEQKVLLRLAGFPSDEVKAWSSEKTAQTFGQSLTRKEVKDEAGSDYVYYTADKDGERRVIFPVSGPGFWDRILGYLAADPKKGTIEGIDFVEQQETPGLGARIEEPWFREQFKGKAYKTRDKNGRYLDVVPEGTASGPHQVDAITGATETSRAVENLLNASIARFLTATGEEASP